jgi:hypothetical protein
MQLARTCLIGSKRQEIAAAKGTGLVHLIFQPFHCSSASIMPFRVIYRVFASHVGEDRRCPRFMHLSLASFLDTAYAGANFQSTPCIQSTGLLSGLGGEGCNAWALASQRFCKDHLRMYFFCHLALLGLLS